MGRLVTHSIQNYKSLTVLDSIRLWPRAVCIVVVYAFKVAALAYANVEAERKLQLYQII